MYKADALDKIDLTVFEKMFSTIENGYLESHYVWVVYLLVFFGVVILMDIIFGPEDRSQNTLINGTEVGPRLYGTMFWFGLIIYLGSPLFTQHIYSKENVAKKLELKGIEDPKMIYTTDTVKLITKEHEDKILSKLKTEKKPKKQLLKEYKDRIERKNSLLEMQRRNNIKKDITYSALLIEPYMYGNNYIFKDKKKGRSLEKFIAKEICPIGYFKKHGEVCNSKLIKENKYVLDMIDWRINNYLSTNEKIFFEENLGNKCEAVKIMYKEKSKSIADKAAKKFKCYKVFNKYN